MEDLPSVVPQIKAQDAKKQTKLKEFREYLVQKQVVLAYVKLLLALRNLEDKKPENVYEYLQDYFGDYKDPVWEEMDVMEEEMKGLRNENQELSDKVLELQKEIDQIQQENQPKNWFHFYGFLTNQIVVNLYLHNFLG